MPPLEGPEGLALDGGSAPSSCLCPSKDAAFVNYESIDQDEALDDDWLKERARELQPMAVRVRWDPLLTSWRPQGTRRRSTLTTCPKGGTRVSHRAVQVLRSSRSGRRTSPRTRSRPRHSEGSPFFVRSRGCGLFLARASAPAALEWRKGAVPKRHRAGDPGNHGQAALDR